MLIKPREVTAWRRMSGDSWARATAAMLHTRVLARYGMLDAQCSSFQGVGLGAASLQAV